MPVDLEGPEAARVGAGGDHDGVRAGLRAGEEAGAAAQAGACGQPAGEGRGQDGRGRQVAGGAAPRGGVAAPAAARSLPRRRPTPLSADQLLQPPAPPTRTRPEHDPAFTQVTGAVKGVAKAKRAHPPAASKAKEAQDAALAPTDDLAGQAKAAKADTMDAQQAGLVRQEGVHRGGQGGDRGEVAEDAEGGRQLQGSGQGRRGQGRGQGPGRRQGKEGQAKDIEAATAAPPDQSKAVPKPVTPMGPEQPGQAAPIPAAGAVPKPAPPEQTNLAAGKHEANQEMADGEVTETQLAESNEPDFQQALADKKAAAAHADTAPGEFRAQETAGHRAEQDRCGAADRGRGRRDAER